MNTIGIETAGLLNTVGEGTAVSVAASAEFIGAGPGSLPELALLGDSLGDCNGVTSWSLAFAGLQDGSYRILIYAPCEQLGGKRLLFGDEQRRRLAAKAKKIGRKRLVFVAYWFAAARAP